MGRCTALLLRGILLVCVRALVGTIAWVLGLHSVEYLSISTWPRWPAPQQLVMPLAQEHF